MVAWSQPKPLKDETKVSSHEALVDLAYRIGQSDGSACNVYRATTIKCTCKRCLTSYHKGFQDGAAAAKD